MKIHISINVSVGRVVKYFILVDLFLLAGWGLIDPVFGIFVVNEIHGATLVTVGIAGGIYWFFKSSLQIPVAKMLDKIPGERDDFYALIGGLIIVGFAAFSFALIREPWQLYLVQLVKALGFGLYAASWPAIFSRHLDKEKVSFDWALDSTAVGISAGLSAIVGGALANFFGFRIVFILGALFTLLSAFVLLMVPDLVLPKAREDDMALRKDHHRPPAPTH